jgi:putative nucleotidyltransferase with HDIG domain
MSPAEPKALSAQANPENAKAAPSHPPLMTVLRVSEGLRQVFGSPGYKPPMLPSVALDIHALSCRPEIDTNKLIEVLEHDPMLAGHVLKVANSPIFRGRDAETSLRSAVLRLGHKNLGEVVFELALHMRVFRSAEYSEGMEQLRRHSTACANLCRLIARRAGQDPEHAFLCGLLHDIGIAAILIVLGEQRRKSEPVLEPSVLNEAILQTHEDVSGMLVQLWKLPGEVGNVVAHHHGREAVLQAPLLSAVVAVADALAAKFKFSVDLGAGTFDGNDPSVLEAACNRLNMDATTMADLEQEAEQVLKHVDESLESKYTTREVVTVEKPFKLQETSPPISVKRAGVVSARKPAQGALARMWRAVLRLFH